MKYLGVIDLAYVAQPSRWDARRSCCFKKKGFSCFIQRTHSGLIVGVTTVLFIASLSRTSSTLSNLTKLVTP
jgi:hypothetical protein